MTRQKTVMFRSHEQTAKVVELIKSRVGESVSFSLFVRAVVENWDDVLVNDNVLRAICLKQKSDEKTQGYVQGKKG